MGVNAAASPLFICGQTNVENALFGIGFKFSELTDAKEF
jgi:hypothetical protein